MAVKFFGGPLDGVVNPPWMAGWDVTKCKPQFRYPVSEDHTQLLETGSGFSLATVAKLAANEPRQVAVYNLVAQPDGGVDYHFNHLITWAEHERLDYEESMGGV